MYEIVIAETEAELLRWNAVRNAADPRHGLEDAAFLRRIRLPGRHRRQLMALDERGRIVAVGQSGFGDGGPRAGIDVLRNPNSDVPFAPVAGVVADALEAWATSHADVRRLTSYAYDHAGEELDFWMSRGWREYERNIVSGVDPSTVQLTEPRADHTVITLAERPELFPAVHRVHNESWFTSPFATPGDEAPYERWKAQIDLWPGSAPDQFLLAVDGDEVLGYAELDYGGLPQPDELWHAYTGVLPRHSGRGIATELKVRSIAWARERGVQRLVASNDEHNLAMRGINQRFGYEPLFAYVGFERQL